MVITLRLRRHFAQGFVRVAFNMILTAVLTGIDWVGRRRAFAWRQQCRRKAVKMRRAPITSDDITRWKAQGLGLGEGAHYKPWIDVRCFSSRGRMSRRLGATTRRVHHLFSDNESFFFLLADHATRVVDIREQFPLFPESATQDIALSLGIRHPKYPGSATPTVMTTDFLLTVTSESGERSFVAYCIKSVDELHGRSRKTVLAKLEIERRYWLNRGVFWYLFTNNEFDKTVIDNLEWLSYFMVDDAVDRAAFAAQIPTFLAAFNTSSLQGRPLAEHLRECVAAFGATASPELVTDMFRYCAWYNLIHLDLNVPIGLRRVPVLLPTQKVLVSRSQAGDQHASTLPR